MQPAFRVAPSPSKRLSAVLHSKSTSIHYAQQYELDHAAHVQSHTKHQNPAVPFVLSAAPFISRSSCSCSCSSLSRRSRWARHRYAKTPATTSADSSRGTTIKYHCTSLGYWTWPGNVSTVPPSPLIASRATASLSCPCKDNTGCTRVSALVSHTSRS